MKNNSNKEVKIVEITMSTNNETVKENKMKKQVTISELSQMANVPQGTIRAWIMKPINGIPYSANNINYANAIAKLTKYFESDEKFIEKFGFSLNDIEIVKSKKSKREYIEIDELKLFHPNTKVMLHNYSMKTELTFQKYDIALGLFIFKAENDDWRAYSVSTISKPNMKLEAIEEENE